jgi:hypothetical protein
MRNIDEQKVSLLHVQVKYSSIRGKNVFSLWIFDSRETQQIDKKLSNACIVEP